MPPIHRPFLLTSATAVLFASAPFATAGETIATDRPDFVESSLTVGRGRVQVEASVAWESMHGGGGAFATPVLLRVGTGERWELRVESDGWVDERGNGPGDWADVSIGAKYHLAGRDGAPSMAWLLHAELPTAGGEPRGRGVRPSVRFVAEWELSGGFGLGVMPGIALERNDTGQTGTAGLLGVVVGRSVGEHGRVFAEVAASRLGFDGDDADEVTFNFGGARLLGPDMQIDLAYSHGMTDAVADRAITVGLSRRW